MHIETPLPVRLETAKAFCEQQEAQSQDLSGVAVSCVLWEEPSLLPGPRNHTLATNILARMDEAQTPLSSGTDPRVLQHLTAWASEKRNAALPCRSPHLNAVSIC